MLEILTELADLLDRPLFALVLRSHPVGLFLHLLQFALEILEPVLAGLVLLLLQRGFFNLKLHHTPVGGVQLGGKRINLRADGRAGLVDQVDGLVRQETVADVAVR
jgi:hypothetical protein